MDWALRHDYIVFTHDLDFGTMLALSHATGPSVLQVRARNGTRPDEGYEFRTDRKSHLPCR